MYETKVHSDIGTDVLFVLLAHVAMEFVSTNNTINVFFKMVIPSSEWYDIFHVINRIGTDICKTLPFFYCFTGFDANSSYNGEGKSSFFDGWIMGERKDELTETFLD